MPTADSFKALGQGNGFAFNPTKVNVASYDKWQTLGGFKDTDSGSPSQAELDLSLSNAMLLYWSLNGGILRTISNDGTARASGSTSDTEVKALSPQELPKDRVLGMNRFESPNFIYNLKYEDIVQSGSVSSPPLTLDQSRIDISIVRMYDGITIDEDNFIGHGISRVTSGPTFSPAIDVRSFRDAPNFQTEAFIEISSFLNDDIFGSDIFDYGVISYGSGLSMPAVLKISANTNATATNIVVSSSPPNALIETAVGSGTSNHAKFFSLDFYTFS